jgi:hypothetical protein
MISALMKHTVLGKGIQSLEKADRNKEHKHVTFVRNHLSTEEAYTF